MPDFSRPPGEPALAAPDSMSWQVFKNPLVLFIGGVAAVVLELAEPRVRSGVWEHTSFREQPLERLKRTALASVMTVYGPRSQAEKMIAHVGRLHDRVQGVTPAGRAYRASDPQLLDWVQATACFGFLEAHHAHVRPLGAAQRDRFYAEGGPAARLYGATGAPLSQAQLDALFARMDAGLEASPIVFDFLRIVGEMPAVPWAVRPLQKLLVKAAVQLVPEPLRERLRLIGPYWHLSPAQGRLVNALARQADRLLLRSSAAVQSCLRLGLPEDYLYGGSIPP
ncbi:MAG TPA: oxygenase MpaB family protein [Albitalea sp.]